EALRAALGHEVTAEDVLRSTATIGGAGLAATPVRRALQGASPWLSRPAIGAAATAGAAAGAAPFEEGTLPERLAAVAPEALGTGLAMGLLYPLGQATPQATRKAVEEAVEQTLPAQIQRPPELLARPTPEPPRFTVLEQPMAPPRQPLALPGSVGSISVTSPVRSVEDVMPGDRVFSQR